MKNAAGRYFRYMAISSLIGGILGAVAVGVVVGIYWRVLYGVLLGVLFFLLGLAIAALYYSFAKRREAEEKSKDSQIASLQEEVKQLKK